MQPASLQELIRKYLNGSCSPEEKEIVENWYQSMEDDVDIMDFLSNSEAEQLKSIIFRNIETQIVQTEKPVIRPVILWRYLTAAMLIIGVGIGWIYFSRDTDNKAVEAVAVMEFINQEKNIQRKILSDGSIAWIHPNSRLTYPTRFTESERSVSMQGEIYFEVTPDSLRPFIVNSGEIQTRVLGTSFVVRSYASDPFAKVSVVTGKVSVSRIEDTSLETPDSKAGQLASEIILAPEETAVFSVSERVIRKETLVSNPDLAIWSKNSLSFDNIPVGSVLETLNKAYGVHISASEKEIRDYMLRADFNGLNLPETLEILSHSLNLTYEMEGDRIVLKKRTP